MNQRMFLQTCCFLWLVIVVGVFEIWFFNLEILLPGSPELCVCPADCTQVSVDICPLECEVQGHQGSAFGTHLIHTYVFSFQISGDQLEGQRA